VQAVQIADGIRIVRPYLGMMQPPKPPFVPTLDLDAITSFKPFKLDTTLIDSLVEIGRAVVQLQANFAKIGRPLLEGFARTFENAAKADAVQAAGWIPHPTMPMARFDKNTPPEEIGAILATHYRDNWPEVRAAMSRSVQSTAIDAEAKATFEEALAAHEAGLYRSVVRVLFPEIERVARETVYGGSRKESWGRKKGRNNAGLSDLREALMTKLPAGVALGTPFALTLVQKLSEHLYSYVPEDPVQLAAFERDPVPNRHASQHGYVTYSSAQHSINMLAMADFMFHVIMRAHAYIDTHSNSPDDAAEADSDGCPDAMADG
jgi:hypothetical protein